MKIDRPEFGALKNVICFTSRTTTIKNLKQNYVMLISLIIRVSFKKYINKFKLKTW